VVKGETASFIVGLPGFVLVCSAKSNRLMGEDRMDSSNVLKRDTKNVYFILNGKMLIWTNNLVAV